MKYKAAFLTLIIAPLALSLSACENTKEQFDFSKQAPDEFAVVKRAPLEMPPNFNVRPPRPGAPRPQEDTAVEEAKQAVFGVDIVQAEEKKPISKGEAILLQKTGVDLTAPDIRDVIDAETRALNQEQKPTIDRILGGVTGRKYEAPASVVDAKAETERIQTNLEQGKSVTDGATPTVTE